MGVARKNQPELVEAIVGRLARRHSTATVLFHHAVAERLGLGPTDLKCLDVLRERGEMTGSELVAITGLTNGAITGVVARLERAGYPSATSIRFDSLERLPHECLGNCKRLCHAPRLLLPKQLACTPDPMTRPPSLHHHCGDFDATTSRSAP